MNQPASSHFDFLRSILENPEGIVTFSLDSNYRYTSFSQSHKAIMKAVWGVDIEMGSNMLDVIANEPDRIKAQQNFNRALQGEYFTVTEEYGKVSQRRFFYEDRYSPVKNSEGVVIGLSVFVIDISQQKHTEHELKDSETKLRSVLEIIPDLIYKIDQHGICLDILSGEKHGHVGHTKVGQPVFENFPSYIANQYLISIRNCLRHKAIQTIEFTIVKNNITILFEARFIPAGQNEVLTLLRDISFQRKTEPELVKLSLIAKHTSNAVVITDASGKIEWVNEGFTRITEYTPDEVVGKKPGSLLQGKESDPLAIALLREKIRSREPFSIEIVNYTKSGKKYWVHINGQPIFNTEGEAIKFFAIETDITQRKLSEIKILEQNTRLTAIAENLTRKNEQLEEFTQIVSHNLRSPIGNISALIEHLNSTPDEEEKREIFDHLKQSTQSLMLTLNELNEVLKIKYAGHIEKELVDFERVFNRVRGMLLLQINETEADVTFNFLNAPAIYYPLIYVESIFVNLLSNALKYYSPDRKPVIHFESWIENGIVKMNISDNGLGIDLKRYGHQVFKLRKTFHAHPESRGVGLFMVKNQIEAMGGSITLTSEVNNGTSFFINFGHLNVYDR
ncbi:MAG TPA: PAS domain S-box protein [Cyclobacteriaceae bacterium]